MAAELWLAVTDSDANALNLLDRSSFRVPRTLTSPNASAYPLITFSGDLRTMQFPVLCLGSTPSLNWQKIATKKLEAQRGSGPWGLASSNIVLWVKYAGESSYSYIDVYDITLNPLDLYQVGSIQAMAAIFTCSAYARSAPVTYGPYTIGGWDRDQAYILTVTGSAGTFTLTKGANTTAAQAFNVSAANLQTALQGLASIGSSKCFVEGLGTGLYRIRFASTLGNQAVTLTTNGGTGGATAVLSVSTSGAVWIPSIPGDVPALARIKLTDNSESSKIIVSAILGRHDHPLLVPTDIVPVMGVTSQSPGADHSDATSRRGTASRLASGSMTSSFQAVAQVALPTTGRWNGRKRVYALCKSSEAVIGQPLGFSGTFSANSGTLGTGTYTGQIVPRDGSGNAGRASALVSVAVNNALPDGTGYAAMNPLAIIDFENQSFTQPWVGPPTLGVGSGTGGSVIGTIDTTAKKNGTYGLHLKAVGGTTGASSTPTQLLMPARPSSGIISIGWWLYPVSVPAASGGSTHPEFTANVALTTVGSIQSFVADIYYDNTASAWRMAVGTGGVGNVGNSFAISTGSWHWVEITFDNSNPNQLRVTTYVDGNAVAGGQAAVTATTMESGYATWQAYAPTGNANIEELYIDDIHIFDQWQGTGAIIAGGSIDWAWEAGANCAGYDLYYYVNGTSPTYRLQLGNVTSYSLTSQTPTGFTLESPPTILPAIQPTQVRAGVAVAATTPNFVYDAEPWQMQLSGSAWEIADLGAHNFPPYLTRQGSTPPACVLQIEAANPGDAATFDVCAVALADERLEMTEVSALGLAAQRILDFDTRYDNEAACLIVSKADGSSQGTAEVTSPMHLGPGGCFLNVLPLISDGAGGATGDPVNSEVQVDLTITPRWQISAGA